MTVAILVSSLSVGGSERAAISLANNFRNKGIAVHLIYIFDRPSVYPINADVKVHKLNGENGRLKTRNTLNNIRNLRMILKNISPDIIYCMNITVLLYAVIATIFFRHGAIIGSERNNPFLSLKRTKKRFLKRFMSLFCDGYIFQTKRASYYYPRRTREKSCVIPNAVYNQNIYNINPPLRRRKTIVAVGRLIEQKRYDVLLKAFARVNRERPGYVLEIFGDGPEKNNLICLAKKLCVYDSVGFRGAVKNVEEQIFDASIYVLTSEYEGMPNALIEAMACGVPPVSADCEMGPRELIINRENGILVPVNDSIAVADAIIELLDNDSLAIKISKNALSIRDSHHIDVIVRQHLKYFHKIMNIEMI